MFGFQRRARPIPSGDRQSMAERTLGLRMLYLGWVGEAVYAWVQSGALDYKAGRTFMLVWWAGAAAFFIGVITGILFGIPRVARNSVRRNSREPNRDYQPNANIEEISDWLTKIIVGLTLVNLREIMAFMGSLGQKLATAFLANQSASPAELRGAQIVALSALVWGFSCGFLYFYFWARDVLFYWERPREADDHERQRGDRDGSTA
jgi:hypothetical protein